MARGYCLYLHYIFSYILNIIIDIQSGDFFHLLVYFRHFLQGGKDSIALLASLFKVSRHGHPFAHVAELIFKLTCSRCQSLRLLGAVHRIFECGDAGYCTADRLSGLLSLLCFLRGDGTSIIAHRSRVSCCRCRVACCRRRSGCGVLDSLEL